ncbi:hypothetical protein [Enteractinococcus coprophilus]|uniref:hypothetical protein n=1 Tax=Enteractinococcus coprophilus TaxID=1027633 RepID=UPI0036628FEF
MAALRALAERHHRSVEAEARATRNISSLLGLIAITPGLTRPHDVSILREPPLSPQRMQFATAGPHKTPRPVWPGTQDRWRHTSRAPSA